MVAIPPDRLKALMSPPGDDAGATGDIADHVSHGHEILVINALIDTGLLHFHQFAQRHQRPLGELEKRLDGEREDGRRYAARLPRKV